MARLMESDILYSIQCLCCMDRPSGRRQGGGREGAELNGPPARVGNACFVRFPDASIYTEDASVYQEARSSFGKNGTWDRKDKPQAARGLDPQSRAPPRRCDADLQRRRSAGES